MTIKKLIQKIKQRGLKQSFWRGLRRVIFFFSSFSVSYYLKRFLIGYSVEKINGYKMYLDLKNDLGISKDLYIYKKRERCTTDFLLKSGFNIIKAGDAVLDIGANIGYYALLWSQLVGGDGVVYCLEPVSNNYEILVKNVKLNNINNIETYKLAAGNDNRIAEINVSWRGNWSSFVNHRVFDNFIRETERVKMLKIDDFLKDKKTPKLARMDVEGYEVEVLKGMQQTLRKIIYLLIEIHPEILTNKQKAEMLSILSKNGFRPKLIFYDKPDEWLNKNGEIKDCLRFVNRMIGEHAEVIEGGKVYEGGDLASIFRKKIARPPHVLFSRT